jgi:hypothetical protein
MEVRSTAKLVDPTTLDESLGITTTLPRSEVEEALRSEDGDAELFLDVARIRDGEREESTVSVSWKRDDLEKLLKAATGDRVLLTFDRTELAEALEGPDVEAQGLREKALVLTVAAATAIGAAGTASAQATTEGGGAPVAAQVSSGFVTDVTSNPQIAPAPGEFVTDATGGTSSAPAVLDTSSRITDATGGTAAPGTVGDNTQFVTDATGGTSSGAASLDASSRVTDATGGTAAPGTVGDNTQFVTDATGGTSSGAASLDASSRVTDATGGTAAPAGAGVNFVTDAGTAGQPVAVPDEGGISMPDPETTGAILGGLALLITGAGFAARRRRHERPAAT